MNSAASHPGNLTLLEDWCCCCFHLEERELGSFAMDTLINNVVKLLFVVDRTKDIRSQRYLYREF